MEIMDDAHKEDECIKILKAAKVKVGTKFASGYRRV